MATEAQMRANTANAQRSTGPRTDQGKAKSAMNAIHHGMCVAATVLLPEEDPELLMAMTVEMTRDLDPQGPMERMLVDRIITAAWRLRRAHIVECGIFERTDNVYDPGNGAKTFTQFLRRKFESACKSADALGKLSRYESAIERSLHRALSELRRLQDARGTGPAEKNLQNEPNSVVTVEDAGNSGAD
jgi:hypothetical protein